MNQIEFLDSFVTIFGIKGIDDYDTKIYSSQYSETAATSILERINDSMPQIKALFQASQLQLSRTNYQVENMTVAFGVLKNLLRQANIPYDVYKSNSRTYLQLKPLNNELREYIGKKMEYISTPSTTTDKPTQTSPIVDLAQYMTDHPSVMLDIDCDEDSRYTKYVRYMLEHNLDSIQYKYERVEPVTVIGYSYHYEKYYIEIKALSAGGVDFIYNPECRLIINNRVFITNEIHVVDYYHHLEYTNVANKYFPTSPSAGLLILMNIEANKICFNNDIKVKINYDAIITSPVIRNTLIHKSRLKIGETDPIWGPSLANKTLFDKNKNKLISTKSNSITLDYDNMYDITVDCLQPIVVAMIEWGGQIIDCNKPKYCEHSVSFNYWTKERFIPMAHSRFKSLEIKIITTDNTKPTDFTIKYKTVKPAIDGDIDFSFKDARGNMQYYYTSTTMPENFYELPNIYELVKK